MIPPLQGSLWIQHPTSSEQWMRRAKECSRKDVLVSYSLILGVSARSLCCALLIRSTLALHAWVHTHTGPEHMHTLHGARKGQSIIWDDPWESFGNLLQQLPFLSLFCSRMFLRLFPSWIFYNSVVLCVSSSEFIPLFFDNIQVKHLLIRPLVSNAAYFYIFIIFSGMNVIDSKTTCTYFFPLKCLFISSAHLSSKSGFSFYPSSVPYLAVRLANIFF